MRRRVTRKKLRPGGISKRSCSLCEGARQLDRAQTKRRLFAHLIARASLRPHQQRWIRTGVTGLAKFHPPATRQSESRRQTHVIIKVGTDIFSYLNYRRCLRIYGHIRRRRRYSTNSVLHLRRHFPGLARFKRARRPKHLGPRRAPGA